MTTNLHRRKSFYMFHHISPSYIYTYYTPRSIMTKALSAKAKSLERTRGRSTPYAQETPFEGYNSKNYSATRNEVGVFTTPPYSSDVKGCWKFKDKAAAGRSCGDIWHMFEVYRYVHHSTGKIENYTKRGLNHRDQRDFIGSVPHLRISR
jgi:hypothetical protein